MSEMDKDFTASVLEAHSDHKHRRLLLAGEPGEIVRLRIGDEVRVHPAKKTSTQGSDGK